MRIVILLLVCLIPLHIFAEEKEIQEISKEIIKSVQPDAKELENWAKDIFLLTIYNECRKETNLFCKMIDESKVKEALNRIKSDEWKVSPIGVKLSTLIVVLELSKDVNVSKEGKEDNKNQKTEPLSKSPEISEEKAEPKIKLLEWAYEWQGRKSSSDGFYIISYAIQNNYGQAIKLIEGFIHFFDLLDARIFQIVLERDVFIESNAISTFEAPYYVEKYSSREHRMKKLNKEDIKAKLQIRKLVLSDNTILEFK